MAKWRIYVQGVANTVALNSPKVDDKFTIEGVTFQITAVDLEKMTMTVKKLS